MRSRILCFVMASLTPMAVLAEEEPAPVDQHKLSRMIQNGEATKAFLEAFEAGDELTEFGIDRIHFLNVRAKARKGL